MEKPTAQQILDVAQEMVRERGYSAFSYADISKRVGIRKASIHYHFPSKDDLVRELVRRYRHEIIGQCHRISQSGEVPLEQLRQFVALYQRGLQNNQICLCAMLAADLTVLSAAVQTEVQLFFQGVETWLSALLAQGQATGQWGEYLPAQGLLALLQGAQLMARSQPEKDRAFQRIVSPALPG